MDRGGRGRWWNSRGISSIAWSAGNGLPGDGFGGASGVTVELTERASTSADKGRADAFLAVFRPVWERYEETLSRAGEIDFHDLVNLVSLGRQHLGLRRDNRRLPLVRRLAANQNGHVWPIPGVLQLAGMQVHTQSAAEASQRRKTCGVYRARTFQTWLIGVSPALGGDCSPGPGPR